MKYETKIQKGIKFDYSELALLISKSIIDMEFRSCDIIDGYLFKTKYFSNCDLEINIEVKVLNEVTVERSEIEP
jgi:hypothetical protein